MSDHIQKAARLVCWLQWSDISAQSNLLNVYSVILLGSYCNHEGGEWLYQYHTHIDLHRSESQGSVCMFLNTNLRIFSHFIPSFDKERKP